MSDGMYVLIAAVCNDLDKLDPLDTSFYTWYTCNIKASLITLYTQCMW